jgi:hypothetical protein
VYLDVRRGDMNGVNYDECGGDEENPVLFREFCKTSCYTDGYYNASVLYYCDIDNILKPVEEDTDGIDHNNDGGGRGFAYVGAPESNLKITDMKIV